MTKGFAMLVEELIENGEIDVQKFPDGRVNLMKELIHLGYFVKLTDEPPSAQSIIKECKEIYDSKEIMPLRLYNLLDRVSINDIILPEEKVECLEKILELFASFALQPEKLVSTSIDEFVKKYQAALNSYEGTYATMNKSEPCKNYTYIFWALRYMLYLEGEKYPGKMRRKGVKTIAEAKAKAREAIYELASRKD